MSAERRSSFPNAGAVTSGSVSPEHSDVLSHESSGFLAPPGLNVPSIPANWADASMLHRSSIGADQSGNAASLFSSGATSQNNNAIGGAATSSLLAQNQQQQHGDNGPLLLGVRPVTGNAGGGNNNLSLENSLNHGGNGNNDNAANGGGEDNSSSSLHEVLRRVGSTSPQAVSSGGTPLPSTTTAFIATAPGNNNARGYPPPLAPFAALPPPRPPQQAGNAAAAVDANAESLSIRSHESGEAAGGGSGGGANVPGGGGGSNGASGRSRSEPPMLPPGNMRTSDVMHAFRIQLAQVVAVLPPPVMPDPSEAGQHRHQRGGGRGGGGRGGGGAAAAAAGAMPQSMINGPAGWYQHGNTGAGGFDAQQHNLEQQSRAVTSAVQHMATAGGGWGDIASLRGHYLEFALDTDGSKMLQRLLVSPHTVDEVFPELRPHLVRLSCHASGNYAVQRMIEFGTELHRLGIVRTLSGFALDFAEDVYGCRVLQKMMDCVLPRSCPWQWSYVLASCTDQQPQPQQQRSSSGGANNSAAGPENKSGSNSNSASTSRGGVQSSGEKEVDPARMFFTGSTPQEQQQQLHLQLLRDSVLLIQELDGAMARIIKDQNGNHVAQKILERAPPTTFPTSFVIEVFNTHMLELGLHCYGCRVAEKVFEVCHDGTGITVADSSAALDRLFMTVASPTVLPRLVDHQYGNYVVQHMLAHAPPHHRRAVLAALTPRMRELACDKFGSNVVERMFKHAALGTELDALVMAVVRPDPSAGSASTATDAGNSNNNGTALPAILSDGTPSASVPVIVHLMRDRFANYVVQKIIDCTAAQPHHRDAILPVIQRYSELIRETTFGQHLLFKVEKAYWTGGGGGALSGGGNNDYHQRRGGYGNSGDGSGFDAQFGGRGGGYRGGRGGGDRGGGRGGGRGFGGGRGGGGGGYVNYNQQQQQQQQMQAYAPYAQQQQPQPYQPAYVTGGVMMMPQQHQPVLPHPQQGLAFYGSSNNAVSMVPAPRSQFDNGFQHQQQQFQPFGGSTIPHPLANNSAAAGNGMMMMMSPQYLQQQQPQQQQLMMHQHQHQPMMADPALFAQVHAYTRASLEANGGQLNPETIAYYATLAATNALAANAGGGGAMNISPNSSMPSSPAHPDSRLPSEVLSATSTTTASGSGGGAAAAVAAPAAPTGRVRHNNPYARS